MLFIVFFGPFNIFAVLLELFNSLKVYINGGQTCPFAENMYK